MIQTSKVICPICKTTQTEDIHDLAMDTGEMEGSFPHDCENCGKEFTVEFVYKPYVKIIKG
ncbi:transcriptional regulator NrdR family protein [Bacillus thermophilus]|uniref:Transcriptional regulator NrdR family protein n=1 Tax=Siminovitchia thermophila TaxID=1245522 RepID=A0ABS2RB39_9BACI|nr:hypothetical protein [Siminovitchia thermophila]MBM7716053.1 transcriptional regulator NrdR family protein [Siminovitchia thermophila]